VNDENYSVKINRRDGTVEVTGADKEWVAEQLDKLSAVFTAPVSDDEGSNSPGEQRSRQSGGGRTQTTRRRKSTLRVASPGNGGDVASEADAVIGEKLTSEAQEQLREYMREREAKGHWGSKQNQAAIIAGFLEMELGFDGISAVELAKVYEVMGWHEPGNPRALINNARERNKYFQNWVGGRVKLSAKGRNFARHDSLEASSS
jgi:hypothetical protein